MRDDLLLRCHVAPFAKPISEREWLRGATRMWELVRKSSNVADYNRTLQKLHYYQWATTTRSAEAFLTAAPPVAASAQPVANLSQRHRAL
jgi:hypothetical protein